MTKKSDELPESLARRAVPALDAILGHAITVLDDGFIRVIDYMGDDSAVVQAARVSYGVGTKKTSEDRGLIRYLMRHRHTTPFEMCELKLHVRVPMDCWRQWIRHRTANVNEYSTRYSIAVDSAQATGADNWRAQATANRQGSGDYLADDVGEDLSKGERALHQHAREVYDERLRAGVAREQARKDLPLSTYTEAYWKIDLHNLLHFLELRMDPHAQHEIRTYAQAIGHRIVSVWCPETWLAFLDYRQGALSISDTETSLIRAINAGKLEAACDLALERGWLNPQGLPIEKSRERVEVEQKLTQLGLTPPWRAP